jgi:hypothetical protein
MYFSYQYVNKKEKQVLYKEKTDFPYFFHNYHNIFVIF